MKNHNRFCLNSFKRRIHVSFFFFLFLMRERLRLSISNEQHWHLQGISAWYEHSRMSSWHLADQEVGSKGAGCLWRMVSLCSP